MFTIPSNERSNSNIDKFYKFIDSMHWNKDENNKYIMYTNEECKINDNDYFTVKIIKDSMTSYEEAIDKIANLYSRSAEDLWNEIINNKYE